MAPGARFRSLICALVDLHRVAAAGLGIGDVAMLDQQHPSLPGAHHRTAEDAVRMVERPGSTCLRRLALGRDRARPCSSSTADRWGLPGSCMIVSRTARTTWGDATVTDRC